MADLDFSIDKFTFRVAGDRLYSNEGLWVQPDEDGAAAATTVRVGVTSFLQQHAGDAAFVTVRPPGTELAVADDLADLETVKVNLGLPSPVHGTIVEINQALAVSPEIINQDPYGGGWLAVVDVPDWPAQRRTLLEPPVYFQHMKGEIEAEMAQT